MSGKPRVGVSLCLLGEEVRHDGGHKRDRFLTEVLAAHFEWVPVCPEVEVGMGTPRDALRLVRDGDRVRMLTIKDGVDWTDRMEGYAERRVEELRRLDLHGFVLKKNSPSCGMERVKLYDDNGVPSRDGVGLFARTLIERLPSLPVEEEGRLNDPGLRENFVTRVFTFYRWRTGVVAHPWAPAVIDFHTRHKMLLLAHSPSDYRVMGRLVARAGELPIEELVGRYEELLTAALRSPAPVRRHVNVMHHLAGFVKERLDGDDKAELLSVIEEYREGLVPLVAPLTLLTHHLREADHPWVAQQIYLEPYPRELALRSRR